MRLSLCLSALLLSVLATPSPAQHPAKPSAPAKDIIHGVFFHGETPYPQSSLETVTGLHPGEVVNQTNLQAATDRLIDTGAFTDVEANLEGPAKATDVVFTLKPTDPSHFLRASFENFIWWQPEELIAELQKQAPLFNGSIPEAGSQQDAIQSTLQQLLAAKHIAATVSSELIAPYPGQPLRIAEYGIVQPFIRIHSLTITGVSPAFTPLTNRLSQTLINSPYNEGLTQSSLQSRILDLYKNAGYQEASITNLTRTIASSDTANIDIDVTATIHEGEPDHVSSVNWPGSQVISTQAFATASKLHTGDLAAQKLLQDSLANLDEAYRNQGYMDVIVAATPTLDTTSHQVAFTVSVAPGPQYHLRNLTVLNLSPTQRKTFDSAWKLHKGDIYNASYVANFLKTDASKHPDSDFAASFQVVEDPEDRVLNLTIDFAKTPGFKPNQPTPTNVP